MSVQPRLLSTVSQATWEVSPDASDGLQRSGKWITVKLQSQEVCCMHASASGRCLVLARQFLLHELHCVEDHDQTVCNTRSFDQF